MAWIAFYLLAGVALLVRGWNDAMGLEPRRSSMAIASVFVVLTWPYGVFIRLKNERLARKFTARIQQTDSAQEGGTATPSTMLSATSTDPSPPSTQFSLTE